KSQPRATAGTSPFAISWPSIPCRLPTTTSCAAVALARGGLRRARPRWPRRMKTGRRARTTDMLEGCTPWPPELAARYRARGYWRDEPLGAIVERGAREFGDREALTSGDRRISYRRLEEMAEHLAQQLWHHGLRPRDRIVVHLNNA